MNTTTAGFPTPSTAGAAHAAGSAQPSPARTLLGLGVLAGPLNLVVVTAQALTRDGFDPRKHAGSMLTLGDLGWIQSANFVVTGVLVVLGALGLRRSGALGSTWAPRLLTVFGLGTVAAGLLLPDPALGFPAGTPDGQPVAMSWHGVAHFAAGGIGFLAFVIACVAIGRRFAATCRRGRAVASYATGVLFLAAFAGIASGSAGAGVTLAFWAAIVLAWTWLAATLQHVRRTA
ncbi:conserved hypothetical protein [Kribbella flavida DSM 17836]|uniref:DUF998 domain-containing protein n=1 Tax=Kribbella flavida (strain DSM 17836 / JCM 10339 / NBRC 14399) TaxID=479435 RepID=D2PMS1_KRIFD|nr:DUF998 domain-containing protein [Kribbella flavida]ADB32623.1 conserved hypothetical protein [Kribbella flavida DSM 17836]